MPTRSTPTLRWRLHQVFAAAGMGLLAGLLGLPTPALASQKPGEPVDPPPSSSNLAHFETSIRPILVQHCYRCHSIEAGGKVKGGLRLDSRHGWRRGGESGEVVIPGKPEESRLIQAVSYDDPDLKMPPKGKLNAEQIASLVEWVRRGAVDPRDIEPTEHATTTPSAPSTGKSAESHWAFQPLRQEPPPSVKDRAWPENSIDAYLLSPLEAVGLSPALEADRATLARRISFDLTGLPPSPATLNEFLEDDRTDAWPRLVDRLLASPQFGERWGRHWLDLARFAETAGHEFDFDLPEAYRYRDYVVQAINEDLPYDQFLVEQIAGDLLSPPRRDPRDGSNLSVIGTGFFWLGEGKHSPVDLREEQAGRIDNQIDVLGKTFLGLTLACARCHDHKFDPILSRDYYSLFGMLMSTRWGTVGIETPEANQATLNQLQQLGDRVAATVDERSVNSSAALLERVRTTKEPGGLPLDHPTRLLVALSAAGSPAEFEKRRTHELELLKPTRAEWENAWTETIALGDGGFRDWFRSGEAFEGSASCSIRPSDADGAAIEVLTSELVDSGRVSDRLEGELRSPTFTIPRKFLWIKCRGRDAKINLVIDGFFRIRDPIYGGLTIQPASAGEMKWQVIDVSMWVGHRAYLEVLDEGPGFVAIAPPRFSDRRPPPRYVSRIALEWLDDPSATSSTALGERAVALARGIARRWRDQGPTQGADEDAIAWWNAVGIPNNNEIQKWRRGRSALEQRLIRPRKALATIEGTGEDEVIHLRGNPRIAGPLAARALVSVLDGDSPSVTGAGAGSGRIELARRWLERPRSRSLLARVIVNRLWQHHFGEGLVRSPDDFGKMGQPPTHPALLDFLARELIRHDWSLKPIHRMILLSRAYRMSSRADARGDSLDPDLKLWHRRHPLRLEAEAIRDAMLAISGRLNTRLGGPSVPAHLTEAMLGRGRPTQSGPLDGDGRRSIAINVRRNFLSPFLLAFDYPIPFSTMGKRSVSNVPAQSLILMNNPFVIGQASSWARRLTTDPFLTSDDDRIDRAYESAFARQPTAAERSAGRAFLADRAVRGPEAAWSDYCHALMNVKEFTIIP